MTDATTTLTLTAGIKRYLCVRNGQAPKWLPDQGFYEDCQVLQSQLGEWPNNWGSAGRIFPNSLLCAKGYSVSVRASGASLARTTQLNDPIFHVDGSNVFLSSS
jgi:hypothetical protein